MAGLQYLRARWYDAGVGRFNRLDPFAGRVGDPQSLHKYAYCHGNPVMGVDPSGLAITLRDLLGVNLIQAVILSACLSPATTILYTASTLLVSALFVGLFGSVLGAADAALDPHPNVTVWDGMWYGFWGGFKYGVVAPLLGPLVHIALVTWGTVRGALDSFENGKDAQGIYRLVAGAVIGVKIAQHGMQGEVHQPRHFRPHKKISFQKQKRHANEFIEGVDPAELIYEAYYRGAPFKGRTDSIIYNFGRVIGRNGEKQVIVRVADNDIHGHTAAKERW